MPDRSSAYPRTGPTNGNGGFYAPKQDSTFVLRSHAHPSGCDRGRSFENGRRTDRAEESHMRPCCRTSGERPRLSRPTEGRSVQATTPASLPWCCG